MAEALCIHCSEPHPSTTAFCPNTGKSMRLTASHPTHLPGGLPGDLAGDLPGHTAASGSQPPVSASDTQNTGLGSETDNGVFDLLRRALYLYKTHAKTLIAVAAIVFVPGALAHAFARAVILAPVVHVPDTAPVAMGEVVAGLTAALLGMLAAAVTGLFLHGIIIPLAHGALALTTADRIAGGNADWREIWAWLFRRLGVVLSALVPAALLMGVGFFFLIVPGLILAFFFSFVPTIALFEGIGGTAALRRSYELVRSDWLRMLLVMMVFGLISGAAQFIAGIVASGLFGSRLLQDALTLIAMPIPVIGSVLLYFDVRRRKEGFNEQQLAKEMATLRGAG